MVSKVYDSIVIGAGPAGIGALTYLLRAKVDVLWLEKGAPGGKLINIANIANCPGFPSMSGFELSTKLLSPLGVSPTYGEVTSLSKRGDLFLLETKEGEYEAKTVLLATGLSNEPKILGEREALGKGVSYCATCDGPLYRNKIVALNGEGEKAYEEALYLSGLAKELHLFYPGASFFEGDDTALWNKGNVVFHSETKISKILCDSQSKSLERILYTEKGLQKQLVLSALFPLLGEETDIFFMRNLPLKTEGGFVLVNDAMETSVPGLFAAGDIVKKRLRQVVTALSDGAIASSGIISYLRSR